MTGVASSVDATTAYLRPYVGGTEFATKAAERGEALQRLTANSTLSEDEAVNALTALHAIPWPDDIMATFGQSCAGIDESRTTLGAQQ